MGSKKKLKVNQELNNLLQEISGLVPSVKGENLAKSGTAVNVKPAPARKKQFTPKVKETFLTLIKERDRAKKRLDEIKVLKKEVEEDRDRVEDRITKVVESYGVPLQGEDAKDKVLFVDPFKAHLVWTERAGTIDTEAVASVFPELLDPEVESVNLSLLMQVLSTYEVPESSKVFVQKFRLFVQQLERSTGQTLIEKRDDRLLNMEQYEEYKRVGKISGHQLKSFESESGSHALRIHKLAKGSRCSQCGGDVPKRKLKEQKSVCRRCGHSE